MCLKAISCWAEDLIRQAHDLLVNFALHPVLVSEYFVVNVEPIVLRSAWLKYDTKGGFQTHD